MSAKACPRCGFRSDGDERYCPRDGAALRSPDSPDLGPDTIVDGRFEIRKLLGGGGMGVVYLANDVRLDRLCALKVLRPDALASAEAVARFHREAANASRIVHPHVVTVYSFDETEDGITYMAMEYVAGRSLKEELDRAVVLPPRPAARIVWQVANALGAAHHLQIVHRDLKPANIMLTRYRDWDDFVKVVDFGIAKSFDRTTSPGITSQGRLIGTPAFMSPEQWLTAEVDHRSDVYSLGLIAVFMLAGGLPPRHPAAATPDDVLAGLPPNDWPAPVTRVLTRCLALDPEDRFQSAAAFAAEFVAAVARWAPPEPGVREPWEARVQDHAATRRTATATLTMEAPPARRRPYRHYAAVGAAGAALLVLGAWFAATRSESVPGPPGVVEAGHDATPVGTAPEDPGAPGTGPAVTAPLDDAPPAAAGPPSDPEPEIPGPSPGPPPPASVSPVVPPVVADAEAALDRLQALLDLDDPDPDSIRLAVDLAAALLDRPLPEPARIEAAYRRAEGLLFLGDEDAACDELRGILPAAEATGVFARSIVVLLQRHCASA